LPLAHFLTAESGFNRFFGDFDPDLFSAGCF
jgi:hypothetical protein